ncbi:unnamed protein product [Mytilus edulis]|uniref:Endonuclease/exonuclease/phosphatase domain-containing protein n=1 Tax=Mytilus edulis TaxID=6550 RepID=A0A8S3VBZ4_MYTED|nr:unnamed protein product [Mytilus edulis]
MYISSFYNPKTANEQGYLEYKRSIDQTASIKNCFIVSGGDFNLPGWDWKAKCLKDNTQHVGIHQRFGDILDDNGLLQIVEEPTRQANTLDLLITNHPNSFTRVEILPGVSDHDIVFAEISVIPSRKKQAARKIPLYSKANWDKMREDINNIKNEIVTMATSKSNINDIWLVFKTSLEKSVNLNIPHKQARTKDSPPWISRDLKRLIRKRDRLYKKKKKSHDKKDSEKYKTIKRQVQQGLRRSYWKYVESIVTPPEDNIIENRGCMKRFWTFIKHKRSDGNEIHDDNITKRNVLREQFADKYQFEGFSGCVITDEKYRSFIESVTNKLETMVTEGKNLKVDFEEKEKKVQLKIDELKENKTKLEQSEHIKRNMKVRSVG